MRKTTNNSQSQ